MYQYSRAPRYVQKAIGVPLQSRGIAPTALVLARWNARYIGLVVQPWKLTTEKVKIIELDVPEGPLVRCLQPPQHYGIHFTTALQVVQYPH